MREPNHTCPVVVVIPSLDPDDHLQKTIDGLFQVGFTDMIIVDDGSRVDCQYIFDNLEKIPGCAVLHHGSNRGKGRALKTAFSYYLEHYDLTRCPGVVTADADGQHLVEDILKTAHALDAVRPEATPSAKAPSIVFGTRNFNEGSVPFKSRSGNRISTSVFRFLYGRQVNDTQTGLRAIPNQFLPSCLNLKGERFNYEINMLISAVQQGLEIIEVPIQTVYYDGNRETHFNTVRDSAQIFGVMIGSFIKFSCSSLLSSLVDQGLFAVLQKIIFTGLSAPVSIPLSTLIARVFSSYLNYSVNRSFVFGAGKKINSKSMLRYYALSVFHMVASAAIVTVMHLLTKADTSLLKLTVDICLFFFVYQIQQRWVFKEN